MFSKSRPVARIVQTAATFFLISSVSLVLAGEKDKSNASSLQGISNAVTAMVNKVSPAVVQINTVSFGPSRETGPNVARTTASGGSGFIIDPTGYILTNAHVVAGARKIEVVLMTRPLENSELRSILKPSGKPLDATLVGYDQETDLALLKIYRSGLPFLELAGCIT